MKHLLTLVAALMIALAMFLLAGCGGSTNSSGSSGQPTADNLNITVYDAGDNARQVITQDYDGTGWNANPGRLWFTLNVAGTRGVAQPDFELWKTDDPENYTDPVADLAGFKTLVAKYGSSDDPSYDFTDLGRYLIRAYVAGTRTEISHTRLTISRYYDPGMGG